MNEYGTLYGIGVGPGDPELITLKAVKILQRVACVFAAASPRNSHSLAEKSISPHLREDTPVVRLNFPMTKDRVELKEAWGENARKIMEVVGAGKDAALITLGDPMTYSTFGYMMRTMSEENPGVPIRIIPGITSFQAASAATGWVLAEGEESFSVVSGALGAERLTDVIEHTDTVVILKVYRHYKEIMEALKRLDLSGKSVLVSQCGLKDEKIVWNPMDNVNGLPPYLSLLLIRKKKR
ncbi:MAG: precorrin-2 C(20)-methyltransferase [Deltaproteobacteria bacterium HGW-Deltaproteobacteria-15]|jgi:precorrin-2/cobalt-factor-2 C20-methyltransferase|nr:MAG: precorrin-2 C(20)-methyltransferase [Deltaproteobacteria bacterium HGW-Deltaproteobacteria-15]